MKYSFIIVLFVIVSIRVSAQVETTEARQNTSGQVNSANSGKGTEVHGKTKAGEEGKITTHSGTDAGDQTRSISNMSGQTTNSKGSQIRKTRSTKKSANAKSAGPSKNANNRNGSKTSSSTTTSGSGKKDM